MLGKNWLFQTYKNHENIFNESELENFLNSIRRSSVIVKIGYHRSYIRLERLEIRIQWPVWKKIYENNLAKELFSAKKDIIEKLNELLKLEKEAFEKRKPAHVLRWLINERIKLYPKLFKYDDNDKKWIENKFSSYNKKIESHVKKSRARKWAVVLGGAAAIFAGTKIYKQAKENGEKAKKEKEQREIKTKKDDKIK